LLHTSGDSDESGSEDDEDVNDTCMIS
jgi:hypothetical protein